MNNHLNTKMLERLHARIEVWHIGKSTVIRGLIAMRERSVDLPSQAVRALWVPHHEVHEVTERNRSSICACYDREQALCEKFLWARTTLCGDLVLGLQAKLCNFTRRHALEVLTR